MSKAGSRLRFGAAKTRSKKAKGNVGVAKVSAGMAVRDGAKAAAHAAGGLAQLVRDEAGDLTERAGELTERATEATRRTGEQAMLRVGELMLTPALAAKLGLKAQRRRAGMLGMAVGAGLGVAAGMLLAKRGAAAHRGQLEDAWADPESLAPPLGQGQIDIRDAGGGPNADLDAPSTSVTA